MSESNDFEQAWLEKFSQQLDAVAGVDIRCAVMAGSERSLFASSQAESIDWTRGAMERLDELVDEAGRRQVMLGCACQYPKASLRPMREAYTESGDADLAHRMLQKQFEEFLSETLQLDAGMIAEIVERGWGAAGVKQGITIIATKIPKSGYLVEYWRETDPEKKRALYCHCPRVRDALKSGGALPSTYCYCGAGFYKGIWEEITQKPVEIELLESVLAGGDVCKVAIRLSEQNG